jgi:hypothetical protein
MARLAFLLPSLALALSCASTPPPGDAGPSWTYFEAAPADLWTEKIADWQRRQSADPLDHVTVPGGTRWSPPHFASLREKAVAFRQRERRALARRVVVFSQAQARRHYKWDPETDLRDDPWPTSRELYAQDGDDCDGVDLIAYDLLRAFGFPESQLYRVVMTRRLDGAHHMATLWFETPDDPWVIDATAAITRRMRRLSELRGWTPIRVFDEDEIFGVAER